MPPNRIGSRRAGKSGRERFSELRREALRRNWRDWVIVALLVVISASGVVLLPRSLAVIAAFMLGVTLMVAVTGWIIGGEVWSLPPVWGAIGEEQTEDSLGALGDEWWVEHDIPHAFGNYDHVVIGPPGVFLLDTKRLSRPAVVQNDELRAGGMRYGGRSFRRGAASLGEALAVEVGWRPWVQAVVVVWGKLDHETREHERVIYLQGENLVVWLRDQPQRLSSDRCKRLAEGALAMRETADHRGD